MNQWLRDLYSSRLRGKTGQFGQQSGFRDFFPRVLEGEEIGLDSEQKMYYEPWAMLLVKILVSIFMVVTLSLIAEFVSPRVAGILSGYPLGAAITLFFIGVEMGPGFASESALYTMNGLIGIQGFIYCYYLASSRIHARGKWCSMTVASLAGMVGYLLIIFMLQRLKTTLVLSLMLPPVSFILFRLLFRKIGNVGIQNRVRLNVILLFGRALFAAAVILFITWAARLVGPAWAGLFSAFPITLFPVMLIVHFSYRLEHVHTLIKNVPNGLVSLYLYALIVHLTYGPFGICLGTITAYLTATLYLIMTQMDLHPSRIYRRSREKNRG
jgi:hypothetical protein